MNVQPDLAFRLACVHREQLHQRAARQTAKPGHRRGRPAAAHMNPIVGPVKAASAPGGPNRSVQEAGNA